jgi:hypothetical protein
MTRYQPLWQQAGSYPATTDRALMGSLWPQGGVTGGVASIVAASMTVSLAPGTAAVPLQAGQGAALCRWDAAEVVTIAAAPASGQSRIDLICAQYRDNALDSGGNNDFVMIVVTGTAAASNPATPATPTNALALASITVVGASANLAGATLTDRRTGRLGVSQSRPATSASGPLIWGSAWPAGSVLTVLRGTANLATDASGNCILDVTAGNYQTGYTGIFVPTTVIGPNLWMINAFGATQTTISLTARYLSNTVIASGVVPLTYEVFGV